MKVERKRDWMAYNFVLLNLSVPIFQRDNFLCLLNKLPWLIICFGIIVRLRQYLFNRSLWWDEAALALNIVHKPFLGFLQPLDYYQTAPAGFLIITKLLVQALGNSEYVLRLISFLAGIISLFLFYKMATWFIKPNAVLIGLSLFVISNYLIYYSAEVKQYSTDVAIILLLYLATIYIQSNIQAKRVTLRDVILFGLLGAIVIWFSYPSVFVLAGVGVSLALFWASRRDWSTIFSLCISYSIWALSFLISYFVYLRNVANNEFLLNFWGARIPDPGAPAGGAFMPLPPVSISDIRWFTQNFFVVFRDPGGLPLVGIAALTFIVGCAVIFLEKKEWFFMLISPILLALLASGFEKYPFSGRLLLFITPTLFIFIAAGANQIISNKTKHYSIIVGVALIGLLFYNPLLSAGRHLIKPYARAEIKLPLNYMKAHYQMGDVIYVYYGAETQIQYYSASYGFSDDDYIMGVEARDNWEKYRNDLDRLRNNKRVWILFSHTLGGEKDFFLNHLDSIGTRLDALEGRGASVYLYDLAKE